MRLRRGPDTETFLKVGARVVSVDIAGIDIAAKNINSQFVKASIEERDMVTLLRSKVRS